MTSFDEVNELFQAYCGADPSYCAQLAVHANGERVVDLAQGIKGDSLLPVYSTLM
jgi:hypothetical protein